MSTPSSLSQSLARLQSAPHEVLTNLPAQIASGRSTVDVRLANLALAATVEDSVPAHIKILSALTLRKIPIETETLKKLGEIVHSSTDPYTICAALSAIHCDKIVDLARFYQISTSLQHELLSFFCSKDTRICHHAILAFSRIHRYKLDSAIAALDRIAKLLQDGDIPFKTRILLLWLLSKVYPDEDAVSICLQQIDAALSDSCMEDRLKNRIITTAVQSILHRQCEPTTATLEALLSRNLHHYILSCCSLTDASRCVSVLSDSLTSCNPVRSRQALRGLLRATGSIPDVLLDQVRSLLYSNCTIPLCLSVLSRHCTLQELQSVIEHVLISSADGIDKYVLVHINALVRKERSHIVSRFFIEHLVDRLRLPNYVSRDVLICLAFILRYVDSISERTASDLATFCQSVSGLPARLVARVCFIAATRCPAVSSQFHTAIRNLFESCSSSFSKYLLCIECLTHGRSEGSKIASQILVEFLSVSPNWIYWISSLLHLAESQHAGNNLCLAIHKLHSVKQCVSSMNLQGRDTAFQLEYWQIRIDFLEMFGICRNCPPSPEQRSVLQTYAARFNRLTCISTSLPMQTKLYLKRLAEMCGNLASLERLLDTLFFTTLPGIFTLYPSDLVSSRVLVSESGQLAITVRLRPGLNDRIRAVSAVFREKHVPLEFRNGNHCGEMDVSDSSGQVVIIGIDHPGQQYQLGSVVFIKS